MIAPWTTTGDEKQPAEMLEHDQGHAQGQGQDEALPVTINSQDHYYERESTEGDIEIGLRLPDSGPSVAAALEAQLFQ